MNTIPPVDLTRQHQTVSQEVEARVLEVLRSGRYVGGAAVVDFETEFANYIGTDKSIGCNSGTDALYMALRALGIGEGDEVITTPFTFIATSEVIVRVGAKPVFIDIDHTTFNFDLDLLAAAVTPQTKAIVAVHLFGRPLNMTKLMAIAKKHNLSVIEDCAQATGASWQGNKVGSIGDAGCFSFFPTKNLGGCGDGGALTTNSSEIAQQTVLLREHGLVRDTGKVTYRHEITGLNSRLDSLQAVILSTKLKHLDRWNEQRVIAAKNYLELLQPLSQIQPPSAPDDGIATWNQFTIYIPNQENGESTTRDLVREKLREKGVISMVYYPLPLHLQPVYSELGYQPGSLPVVEQAAQEVLSLPMFPGITLEEQQQVVFALKDCL